MMKIMKMELLILLQDKSKIAETVTKRETLDLQVGGDREDKRYGYITGLILLYI